MLGAEEKELLFTLPDAWNSTVMKGNNRESLTSLNTLCFRIPRSVFIYPNEINLRLGKIPTPHVHPALFTTAKVWELEMYGEWRDEEDAVVRESGTAFEMKSWELCHVLHRRWTGGHCATWSHSRKDKHARYDLTLESEALTLLCFYERWASEKKKAGMGKSW